MCFVSVSFDVEKHRLHAIFLQSWTAGHWRTGDLQLQYLDFYNPHVPTSLHRPSPQRFASLDAHVPWFYCRSNWRTHAHHLHPHHCYRQEPLAESKSSKDWLFAFWHRYSVNLISQDKRPIPNDSRCDVLVLMSTWVWGWQLQRDNDNFEEVA